MNQTEQSNPPTKSILIDTTFLFDQFSKRGIGRYGKEVLKRLIKVLIDEGWQINFIGFSTLKQNLIQLGITPFVIDQYLNKINFYSAGPTTSSGVGNVIRWIQNYRDVIKKVNPDVYYAIHFERGLPTVPFFRILLGKHVKTIVMAHDAIPLATNSYSQKGFLQNILKGIFYKFMFEGVKKADQVLTNSNFSKNDLIKFGGIDPDKIHAIYLGIDESFYKKDAVDPATMSSTLEAYFAKDQNYFFYDSGLEANKGADKLLEILQIIFQQNDSELPNRIVITGGDFFKGVGNNIKPRTERARKFLSRAQELGIKDNLIVTDRPSNEDLEILLFNAQAYINLSQYEGFSFGPVQAMAAQIPAIAANSSCVPEVTDGGAFLINTSDTDFAAKKIIEFLKDKPAQKAQMDKGIEVVKRYSWDTTVEKSWEVIKSLA